MIKKGIVLVMCLISGMTLLTLSGCGSDGDKESLIHKILWAGGKEPNEEADSALYKAVLDGDFDKIDQALKDGANIDSLSSGAVSGTYNNPFAIALFEARNKGTAKYLLQKGADPNAEIQYGVTAMMYGVMNDDYDLVKFMLENGADVTIKDYVNHETALDYAAWYIDDEENCIEMVDLLLKHGAKITDKTVKLAVCQGDASLAMLDEVLPNYTSVHYVVTKAKEYDVHSGLSKALEAAIIGDSDKLIKLVKADKVKEKEKDFVLCYAAGYCNPETLKCMFQNGYSMDTTDKVHSLLMIAAICNNVENLNYLYEQGLDIEAKTNYPVSVGRDEPIYETALYLAIEREAVDTSRWLVRHNALFTGGLVDIKKDEDHGKVAELIALAENCDVAMIKMLIEEGYCINQSDIKILNNGANSLLRRSHCNKEKYDAFKAYLKDLSKTIK